MADRQGITVVSATLNLMVQKTQRANARVFQPYFDEAARLLDDYGLSLSLFDCQIPPLEFGVYDDRFDADLIRKASEKQAPGRPDLLRVMFADFQSGGHSEAVTEGDPAFIVIDTARPIRATDKAILIHEMVHAAGFTQHDGDLTSVFADGRTATPRTVLKPEYAQAIQQAFFSSRHA
jgi:hypothetical protein